jgi:hypothetical protein
MMGGMVDSKLLSRKVKERRGLGGWWAWPDRFLTPG